MRLKRLTLKKWIFPEGYVLLTEMMISIGFISCLITSLCSNDEIKAQFIWLRFLIETERQFPKQTK